MAQHQGRANGVHRQHLRHAARLDLGQRFLRAAVGRGQDPAGNQQAVKRAIEPVQTGRNRVGIGKVETVLRPRQPRDRVTPLFQPRGQRRADAARGAQDQRAPGHRATPFRDRRHRSEQWRTSSQTAAHLRRQAKDRPQVAQVFSGKSPLRRTLPLAAISPAVLNTLSSGCIVGFTRGRPTRISFRHAAVARRRAQILQGRGPDLRLHARPSHICRQRIIRVGKYPDLPISHK